MKMMDIRKIRNAFFEEGLNKNEISKQFHRSWDTVNRIINASIEDLEEEKVKGHRQATVVTPEVLGAIREMLSNERAERIKKKQRLTSKVIYEELIKKGIYSGSLRRLEEIVKQERLVLGMGTPQSYLPLYFPLGSTVQIDHGEVECIIGGIRMQCFLFVSSVPGTTLRYCQLFPRKSREMWGDFHERTFQMFKGIFPKVVYDNDTVLISDVDLKIRTEFSAHLVEQYKFEPYYCNPAAGNEKGSVENGVGYCRRNYFFGRPEHVNFEVVNQMLEDRFFAAIETEKDPKTGRLLKDIFEEVSSNLLSLSPKKHWARRDKRVVNSYQQVEIEGHFYSVPEKYVGKQVRIAILSFRIAIEVDESEKIFHKRMFTPGEDSLYWEHYLEQLQKKPGALWDCRATQELLDDPFVEKAWALVLKVKSPREARKEFIDILFLRRKYGESLWHETLIKGINAGRVKKEEMEALLKLSGEEDSEGELNIRTKPPYIELEDITFSTDQYMSLCGGKTPC